MRFFCRFSVLVIVLLGISISYARTVLTNGSGAALVSGGKVLLSPDSANPPPGSFVAVSSWPVLNTATTASPTDTYAEYALRFADGAVPAGDAVVVHDSSGNPIPISVGQKSTWPDGSTKIVAVWSRHGSIPANGSVGLTIGHATQPQDTTSRRTASEVSAQNISLAFTGVKHSPDLSLDGSGNFHCSPSSMGAPLEHPLSGPVVDLFVYGGLATDDAGGTAAHMYCRFYVWMPTKADGTADAPRVIAEVRNEDFAPANQTAQHLDLMQLHATLTVNGTDLRTYNVGVNADGSQCKPNCIGMQAFSAWWTANTNGMPFWAANGAAQDAIYAQQDEFYNRSTKIGMPYDLAGTNLATKTMTPSTYNPYGGTSCGWSMETGTGSHTWIQPAPIWDTDRIFANTISYWQQSNVCTLLATSYSGSSIIDPTTQRIPNVTPNVNYQSPPNPNYGAGAPGWVYPGGQGGTNVNETYTLGGASIITYEDYSHYPSGLSFQTYLHSGDYHLIEPGLERMGGGLFAGYSNQVNLRNFTLDGTTYYGLNISSANSRALGWRMAGLANMWTILPDGVTEKAYFFDVAKQQVDYMNQYYADHPDMAALGVWAVSANYRTWQESHYMNNYITYGIFATDQLFGSAMPEARTLALTSLKHYTDSLVTYNLGPTFVAISQGMGPWSSSASATAWRKPEDMPFFATGSFGGRNTASWSLTVGSNILAMDARTDSGNRNIHPSPCDKVYIIDRTNQAVQETIPTGLSTSTTYYATNINFTNPAAVTFQISATCNNGVPGAPVNFDGSQATHGNLSAIPGYNDESNIYMRITTPNTVVTPACTGNIEFELHGLIRLATALGYPNAAAALAKLNSDPAPMTQSNCNINTSERRWDFTTSW